jgi:hypothetical protein
MAEVDKQSLAASLVSVFVASIRSIALSVTALFGSTYLCEEAFFWIKIVIS